MMGHFPTDSQLLIGWGVERRGGGCAVYYESSVHRGFGEIKRTGVVRFVSGLQCEVPTKRQDAGPRTGPLLRAFQKY
jgi:hypothetical protein